MAGCPLTSSWPLTTTNSMRRWSTSFTGFLIPNSLVATWSPEQNYLRGSITVFRCYILPPPAVGQPGILFYNPTFFHHLFSCRPLYKPLDKEITRSISHIQENLLSTWDLHPATTWTANQAGRVFYPMVWCIGRCAHFKGANASSKSIQDIEWSICVCTCSPSFLYQDQNLLSFPAARISSNSSSNIPKCDANEPILFFLTKMIFKIHIRTRNP